jgi:hypothetical protein
MRQSRRPIPLYCNRDNKSPHNVVTVTTQVTYTDLSVATSWFNLSVSLHVNSGAIFLHLYSQVSSLSYAVAWF